MELTDIQKKAVKQWVGEGCSLSDIQKRLGKEHGLTLTYMDVRFLVIDLGLQVKEQAARATGATSLGAPAAPAAAAPDLLAEPSLAPGPAKGGVTVELDRITRPGAVVSGSVTFSDGATARWVLDQSGRLGLEGSRPGYRPSEQDVQAFQEVLSRTLQEHGF